MSSREFPYVIHRPMPTVYIRWNVVFTDQLDAEVPRGTIVVHCPDAYADGYLTNRAREELIEHIAYRSQEDRRRMCAVFAKNDCVYVEPDGSRKVSDEPPSGGVQMGISDCGT